MRVLVINYATEIEESVRFYQALGLSLDGEVNPVWTELRSSAGVLAIHDRLSSNFPKSGFEVCFVSEKPLEEVQESLRAAGFDPGALVDEDFGQSLRVTDPDGNELQINDR